MGTGRNFCSRVGLSMAGSGREAKSARAGHIMRRYAAEQHNALIDRSWWGCWPMQGASQAEAQLLRRLRHLADAGGGCCLRAMHFSVSLRGHAPAISAVGRVQTVGRRTGIPRSKFREVQRLIIFAGAYLT